MNCPNCNEVMEEMQSFDGESTLFCCPDPTCAWVEERR